MIAEKQFERFENIAVGDELACLKLAPISRLNLALYCGASGDHNPIHVDSDFAKSAGQVDVFAHGMLSMAWLGRMLTNHVPQEHIREFSVRFAAITHVHEEITCKAVVMEKFEIKGEQRLRLALTTMNLAGEVKLAGEAVVAL
jgi:acyl dehydratase